ALRRRRPGRHRGRGEDLPHGRRRHGAAAQPPRAGADRARGGLRAGRARHPLQPDHARNDPGRSELKPDLGFHYLAVDGPIGVGKTTLVEMLAHRYEGVKILEDVDNPFLGDFYQDRPGAAFQTELYFLLSRYKQQQEISQGGLFDRLLVSDYTFWKNRIFAYLNLSDDELMLFDKLYALLEPQIPVPDLVLYLVADVDTCMERIRRRARSIERTIAEE